MTQKFQGLVQGHREPDEQDSGLSPHSAQALVELQLRRKHPDHVTRYWLASRAGHKPEPWGNPTSTEGKVLGLELQAVRQSQHNCVEMTPVKPSSQKSWPQLHRQNIKDPN